MVCKEDVLLWFKDLEGYERIDVLYKLLNMCIPFELRFLSSCIEDFGKHSYQELQGSAVNSNDIDRLSKDLLGYPQKNLFDESVRHRVLISVSLLSSKNSSVANWLYKSVLRTDWLEEMIVKGNLKDENIQSELLLLFIMALHHPAFTFEQRLYFSRIFTHLLEFKENKSRHSPKPSIYGYPPGFGYPTLKQRVSECPLVNVKSTVSGDNLHQHMILPPQQPTLLQPVTPTQELPWNHPGGVIICGAPEVPPFSTLPTMPSLVNESSSPNHSRSTSPHQTLVTLRPSSIIQNQRLSTTDIVGTQLSPIDSRSVSNISSYFHPGDNFKVQYEDLNSVQEEKLLDGNSWGQIKDHKQQNGLRHGGNLNSACSRPFTLEQIQTLSLDAGETSLHQSNSSSSSSLNQTPPGTPAVSVSSSHCVKRVGGGSEKPQVNGVPPPPPPQAAYGAPAGIPLCDATTSSSPHFNSCSVPYTTYPFTAIPARSVFPYTQTYRPPFPHFSTNENSSFSTYPFHYMSIIYPNPQFPSRNLNCYNCGAMGHMGQDCNGQNVEDITQKKTFTIEFCSANASETDK